MISQGPLPGRAFLNGFEARSNSPWSAQRQEPAPPASTLVH